MNRLFFVIPFVLIAGLTSCNKEADQIPTPAKARTGAANALPPVVIAQKRYQLIQRGSQVLTYETFSNRLSQVTSTAQYGGTTYYYYTDTPGNKSIKTSRYLDSHLMNKNIFRLDDNGLCTQADYWSYIYDSNYSQTQPSNIFVVHKQYEYSSNGRLSYTTTTAESAIRGGSLQPFGAPRTDSFYYNTKGDLVVIYSYVNQKKTAEAVFGYGPSVGQPDADDKLPLNSAYVSDDRYLPIFGLPSTHLVRSEATKDFEGLHPDFAYKTTYDYSLNKEGYVVSMDLKRWDKFTLTEVYQYSPVPTFPF